MSRADQIFKQNCRDILQNGVWDTDQQVRPHWDDGTPAHTVKKFGIVNRYDLRQEFPILTLRRTYFKTCILNEFYFRCYSNCHNNSICFYLNSRL